MTLIRPVEKETQLQNLELLSDDELRVDFLNQADKIRKMILTKTPAKIFNRGMLDGPQFLQLATAYVNSINAGKAPSLDYAWNYVKSFENEKIFLQIFNELKDSHFIIRNRLEVEEFETQFSKMVMDRMIGDIDENTEQLIQFEQLISKELNAIYERHKNKLNSLFSIMLIKILTKSKKIF